MSRGILDCRWAKDARGGVAEYNLCCDFLPDQ
jgi:hypothetical protein